jgi:signal transduction histidine kinase
VVVVAATVLALGLALVMALIVQRADQEGALRRADLLARTLATEVVGPQLDSAQADRHAVLDELLRAHEQEGDVVRTKIWAPDGEIVWADDHRLIGQRYELAPEDEALVGTTDAYAVLTDLSKPENEYEKGLDGAFIEVYAGFFDQKGRPLLFETYLPADEFTNTLRRPEVLGVSLGWLVVLLAVLLPVAAWLARRVDRAQAEQQRLLRHAVEASELERRRLAQDLHDGVIQDLAAVGYLFNALEAQLGEVPTARATARRAGEIVRRDVLALRVLSTDLYPPDLAGNGLEAALEEMLGQCRQAGLESVLNVEDRLDLPATTALVAYRVVREALRNVVRHAGASRVVVDVQQVDGELVVCVADDGCGFDPSVGSPEGHLGLRVLRDSVTDVHGQVDVRSAPDDGTRVSARLPVAPRAARPQSSPR